jgi:hypothetical protein
MSTQNPFEQDEKKLPSVLNVLTILTFIGCVFQLVSIPISKWLMSFALKMMDNPEQMEKLSEEQVTELQKSKQLFDLMEANYIPLWIVTLLSVGLCFYGALQMRKRKKEGFYLYTVGELLPLVGGSIILGFSNQFFNTSSYIFGIGIPLLFILLYATQLKHMTK